LSVFATSGGPCYRCLFREPPPNGLIPNCAEAGVFGALPGVIGAAQAIETIKVILGVGDPLVGRFQIFDAMTYRWRELEIRRDPGCPVCGDEPTQGELIDYEAFCGATSSEESGNGVLGVEPGQLAELLAADPKPTLLDVREPLEWELSNLEALGAILVPKGEVPDRLNEIPRDRPVVVYCQGGGRSAQIAGFLADQGFERVMNLEGGIMACGDVSLPDEPTD
ncbi:MAG: ThiF family adenylyltransferase, partial [Longimicrobiales bacterium]